MGWLATFGGQLVGQRNTGLLLNLSLSLSLSLS